MKYKNRLTIKAPDKINLEGLPNELSKIDHLRITGRKFNSDVSVPMNFRSFKGLPEILPKLEKIEVYDSTILNFESLTAKIPLLKNISFYNCHLHNLKGLPRNHVVLTDCTIDSFKGLEGDNIHPHSESGIFLSKTVFSSLRGINRTTLHSILIEYFSRFGNLYAPANLTSKGIELLNDCVNYEVNSANNPLEFIRREIPQIYPQEFHNDANINSEIKHRGVDYFFNNELIDFPPEEHWNENKASSIYEKEDWVYGLSLEENLFIPEKIDRLLEFFGKSPTELALQYRSDPKSLPKDQIERLIHEADSHTLKILEDDKYSLLLPNDPVIAQILRRFTVWIKNGKIL
jgi:hypothetical protein